MDREGEVWSMDKLTHFDSRGRLITNAKLVWATPDISTKFARIQEVRLGLWFWFKWKIKEEIHWWRFVYLCLGTSYSATYWYWHWLFCCVLPLMVGWYSAVCYRCSCCTSVQPSQHCPLPVLDIWWFCCLLPKQCTAIRVYLEYTCLVLVRIRHQFQNQCQNYLYTVQ